ncbi:MAG TPA: nicotinamide-nucleotide amidohydrolase family protein [Rhodocyclaceae bacterium]|nr:nicotinamide-nucleotide amidohydrolase family protein [Rhodocyclaceae bacterium]
MDAELRQLSEAVGAALARRQLLLACAESCTGGWAAAAVTATAGSSNWFERGFVTYSNSAKQEMLGVPEATLADHGAVSEETARAMAEGALAHSRAGMALAITGIAGPGGGSPGKPVGTVCFSWCAAGAAAESETRRFSGEREQVRRSAVIHALSGLLARLEGTAKTVP